MNRLTILRDRPLCDGTPRREKGVRAVWRHAEPSPFPPFVKGQYFQSPLFGTEARARTWARFVEAVLADGAAPETVHVRWDAFAAHHPERGAT